VWWRVVADDIFDIVQFFLGFDIDLAYAMSGGVSEFVICFADSRENDMLRGYTSLEGSLHFAIGDNVSAPPHALEDMEEGDMSVCLHGITDEAFLWQGADGLLEEGGIMDEGLLRITIEWRGVKGEDVGYGDMVAMQETFFVGEEWGWHGVSRLYVFGGYS